MLIRRELPADIPAVRAVTVAAFTAPDAAPGAPEPVEAGLLDELRVCDGWLDALSLVAVDGPGEVVGHVVCTRSRVGGVAAVGLGPLSVRPDRQRRGVGAALTHSVLGAADALGEPFVALLGSPAYYGRYGFRVSTDYGILPPDPAWGEYFQVRTLTAYATTMRGTFTYAEPFTRL